MKTSFRTIETLGRPVVALLGGAALGGGWEVALIGHARFALDDPKIRFGTPEVTLGLIPGATGITKTVRKLGLMAAQPYLLEGKLFGPREAVELGWVEALAADADEMRAAALAWIAAHPAPQQPWDERDYRMPGGAPSSPKIAAGLAVAPAMLLQKTRDLYPAAEAILETMVEGALVDYDTATRIESRKLAKVMVSQTAKNMIQAFFFDLNAIKSGKSRPAGFPAWKPRKVGVLGAGMMGAGIAHANAARGIAVVLKDVSPDKVEAGLAAVKKVTASQVAKGRMDPLDEAKLLGLITPTVEVGALDGCELIIEAVFENRALKAEVTREAEPLLAPDGVFASNTSTLPISGLATASAAPERFVGLHFFSPVHKMKLVEIIRGKETERRDDRPRLRLRAGDRQDADRGQRLARLLHQPRVRHLRDGRRDDARRRRAGAAGRARGAGGRHAGRAAGGARRDLAVALGPCHGPDPRRPRAPKGAATCSRPASSWSSAWSRSSSAPAARAAAASTTIPQGGRQAPLAGTEDAVRDAGGAGADMRRCSAGACSTGRRSRPRAASPRTC